MKHIITLAVMLLMCSSVFSQNDFESLASQAEVAYNAGDFGSAAKLYGQLIKAGVKNGEIYFNLGNTYYQLKDFGHALLFYRRAELFTPRDENLRLNMMRVRAQRVDGVSTESGIDWQIVHLTSDTLSIDELVWLLIGLLWLCCSLGIVYYIKPARRAVLKWMGALSFALLVVASALCLIRVVVHDKHLSAVIVSENVSVMTGPANDYLEIFILHAASEIRVIETKDGWVRFQLPDLREGWIEESNLEII